jgi:regulator-associated protein of mTOR
VLRDVSLAVTNPTAQFARMTALLGTHPRSETPQLQHQTATTASSSTRRATSQRRLQLSPSALPPPPYYAVAAAHGNSADMTLRSDANGSVASAAATANTNGSTSRFMSQHSHSPDQGGHSNVADDSRPSSAPGRKNGLSASEARDDSEPERQKRPAKPLLVRSKSEYARPQDDSDPGEDEIPAWGARHGFEDHYQSEHIITQLASVSAADPLPGPYQACRAQDINRLERLER